MSCFQFSHCPSFLDFGININAIEQDWQNLLLSFSTSFIMDLVKKTSEMSIQNNDETGSKRKDYIDWEDYFMAMALLAAKRSKDPNNQVGACIINKEKKIVGIGYNGMPKNCDDDKFPWGKNNACPLDNKSLYVCHAEMNAILNKNSANVQDCTIYVGLFPCNECTKMIIQSGITEVVYLSDKGWDKPKYAASKKMFDAARINYSKYVPKHEKIEISFNSSHISPSS